MHGPNHDQPDTVQDGQAAVPKSVRVAAVQYSQQRISDVGEFFERVESFVQMAASYGSDFVVFPELFTLQLLSMEPRQVPASEAVEVLDRHSERMRRTSRELAQHYQVNLVGGSHLTRIGNGTVGNICYVCLRDGSVHEQAKLHPTPDEVSCWNVEGGNSLGVIQTDRARIGVQICYDCEFPELSRHLADQGAEIIFVPFFTDERQGYMRVRHCCQARAVENQCYVVISGNVGSLPNVDNVDLLYAQSGILTPCDFGFPPDGVAAETTPGVEGMAVADLDLAALREARRHGTVRNLEDRRQDLYQVRWLGR